ncbi:hypothetical protein HanIR_Chr12g0595561 [Helianthus annuus]|nr:hypothetical protein HanIR_Chr12g0595561 [Helianthus annuus]
MCLQPTGTHLMMKKKMWNENHHFIMTLMMRRRNTSRKRNLEYMNVASDEFVEEDVVKGKGKKKGKFINQAMQVDWTLEEELLTQAYVHVTYD